MSYNRATYPLETDPEGTFHNYNTDWTPAYQRVRRWVPPPHSSVLGRT